MTKVCQRVWRGYWSYLQWVGNKRLCHPLIPYWRFYSKGYINGWVDNGKGVWPPKYRPSTAQVEKLVTVMNDDYLDVSEIMKLCSIVRRKTMHDSYIAPALADGSIERKYPEHPNHPKQMYRLTEKAKNWKKSLIE